ncbi:MAG: hypothetical protein KKH67_07620 [candidate division Zixibacteria bacterium]|nr:hypothetical protein [candidate division Zixibacteria bacterium]
MIAYGMLSAISDTTYPLLERIADWIALIATLIGVGLTAVVIYMPINVRPPEKLSLYFTAPIVIVGVLIALGYSVLHRKQLPPHVLSGFALLGISGALFRLLI